MVMQPVLPVMKSRKACEGLKIGFGCQCARRGGCALMSVPQPLGEKKASRDVDPHTVQKPTGFVSF